MRQLSAISTEISEKAAQARNCAIFGESLQRYHYERKAELSQWREISTMLTRY